MGVNINGDEEPFLELKHVFFYGVEWQRYFWWRKLWWWCLSENYVKSGRKS